MNPENENQKPPSQPILPSKIIKPTAQPTQPESTNTPNSTQEVPPTQNRAIVSNETNYFMPESNKSKRKQILIIVGIILIIVLVAIGAYFTLKGDGKVDQNKKTESANLEKQESRSVPQAQIGSNKQISKDTERKNDINKIDAALKSYGANELVFPMLNEINRTSFRQQNLPMLNDDLLRDPDSAQSILVGSPSKNAYSYKPLGSDGKICDNTPTTTITSSGPFSCTKYKLTAVLEDGTKYEKTGLSPEY